MGNRWSCGCSSFLAHSCRGRDSNPRLRAPPRPSARGRRRSRPAGGGCGHCGPEGAGRDRTRPWGTGAGREGPRRSVRLCAPGQARHGVVAAPLRHPGGSAPLQQGPAELLQPLAGGWGEGSPREPALPAGKHRALVSVTLRAWNSPRAGPGWPARGQGAGLK